MQLPAQPDLLIGRTLGGRWQLCDVLATGGMGCVYLARSVALDSCVVVKVLRPELAASPAAGERFRREAMLASRLAHPNIVSVLDFGQTEDGLLYLVMEFVSGRSLAELVRNEGAQPIARVVALMRQLLAAIGELHADGVVHGDIKSDNLLVQPTRAGGGRLKLVDFGLARRLGADEPMALQAGGETAVGGTPEYMAPEVIRGDSPSVATDLYAAGVVLYELLTGELPFAAPTPLLMMERHLFDDAVPPSVRCPERAIPPAFDSVVARAMAKQPADRFAATGDLLAALEAMEPGPQAGAFGRRCEGCGVAIHSRFRFCPACGVPAQAHTDRDLRDSTPTLVETDAAAAPAPLARGSVRAPRTRSQQLRGGIGRAIMLGDLDQAAALYLGLAELLRDHGDGVAAQGELGEAVDLLTLGDGPRASAGPSDMWRLLLLLAEVQATGGHADAARVSAAHAYRHADRVRSARGRASAQQLLRRLSP